jgi:hypothetical protein
MEGFCRSAYQAAGSFFSIRTFWGSSWLAWWSVALAEKEERAPAKALAEEGILPQVPPQTGKRRPPPRVRLGEKTLQKAIPE